MHTICSMLLLAAFFYQLAKSGLPFYGLDPYHNNLPIDHPENAAAVAWAIGDVADGLKDGNPGAAIESGDAEGKSAAISRWAPWIYLKQA